MSVLSMVARGNPGAFDRLVEKYRALFRWHIRRFFTCHADKEDALQECYMRAFQSAKNFEGVVNEASYLTTVCIRACIALQAKLRRQKVTTNIESEMVDGRDYFGPTDAKDLAGFLLEEAGNMSSKNRHALEQVHLKERRPKDVAKELGVKRNTVQTRLQNAKSYLRDIARKEGVYHVY